MFEVTFLELSRITADPEIQARERIAPERVAHFQNLLEDSVELEPVTVFRDAKGAHWLGGGFARLLAHHAAGQKAVRCHVRPGERRDALIHSCGDNARHGQPMTDNDYKRAVKLLLEDDEWGVLPALVQSTRIARHIGWTVARVESVIKAYREAEEIEQQGLFAARDEDNDNKKEDEEDAEGECEETTSATAPIGFTDPPKDEAGGHGREARAVDRLEVSPLTPEEEEFFRDKAVRSARKFVRYAETLGKEPTTLFKAILAQEAAAKAAAEKSKTKKKRETATAN